MPSTLLVPQHLWSYSASLLDELRRIHAQRPVDVVEAPNWDSEAIAVLLDGGFNTVVSIYTSLATVKALDPALLAGNPHVDAMLEVERFCYESASALKVCGPEIRNEVESRYGMAISDERLGVVAHGLVDVTGGVEPVAVPDRTNVLFVGRLERRKGIDTLLSCAPALLERFPDLVFTIAGDDSIPGEEGVPYRLAFEGSPAGPAAGERVQFLGPVDDAYRQQLYAGCDLFVAPSRFESFGLILVEAMMFGKPVIGGNGSGMRAIVEPGGNGFLVPPGDAAALEEAIAELLASPERRREFGRRSRQIYEERFLAQRMVVQTNQFYDRLVGRATTRRAATRDFPPLSAASRA